MIYLYNLSKPNIKFHNNSANTSTQWTQHVPDNSAHLINKLTHLINIDLLTNCNQCNKQLINCLAAIHSCPNLLREMNSVMYFGLNLVKYVLSDHTIAGLSS